MDDNRILTNKIFKQKINELVGADVIELEAANDDLALNCKIFEAGMDAVKGIISDGGSLVEHTIDIEVDFDNVVPLNALSYPSVEDSFSGFAIKGDQVSEGGIFYNKLITDIEYRDNDTGSWIRVSNTMAEPAYANINYIIPNKPLVVRILSEGEYETWTIIFYTSESVNDIDSLMNYARVHYIEYSQEDNSNA